VFDERQVDLVSGRPFKDARSELWVIDAWDMREPVTVKTVRNYGNANR
jgi:hypothetical protein